ncbi:MAG TPA: hypothetical protein VHZ81_09750 [Galbitalea sp.]|nr:hypothetical protein [Galbitalea sp.]
MKPPNYDDTALIPLSSDANIQDRVEQLIGRANQRQLWLLFLDELDLQLPLLIPIDGLPSEPSDEQTAQVLDRVREVMGEIGASSLVVVIERYGPATLTPQDIEWSRSLRRACDASGVALRAQLLSHRTGVRWIAADDIGTASDS